ncbi:AmmeMemoRadiSam system protein A [Thalassomonas viridans]|uniref:AmmeMemoRadiSam system protein A n=1 Tax=Thalassomonas viridans TaxID=137584 RepID=A0AAF0CAZ3_9GAMM|nr:AmmeMemoRadiSam system protein A [Thalassomonas viridans]WDE09162.1 AmmeMemoRadiSam system protein A [Thalassomonas viridans]
MPALSCIELNNNDQLQLKDLIWQVLRQGVKDRILFYPPRPSSAALQQIAASFVTLYIHDQLRGCIGTTTAKDPLWRDACRHGFSCAFEDYRFASLTEEELADARFEISILSPMVAMANTGEQNLVEQLEAGSDGLVLKEGNLHAVFLPSVWKKLPAADAFVRALKEKGGWSSGYWSNDIEIFRFRTFICR